MNEKTNHLFRNKRVDWQPIFFKPSKVYKKYTSLKHTYTMAQGDNFSHINTASQDNFLKCTNIKIFVCG